jgi:hypothetical protein
VWKRGLEVWKDLSPHGDEVVATTATERSLFASDFQLGFLTFYVVMFSYKVIKLCFQNCDEGKTTALTICNWYSILNWDLIILSLNSELLSNSFGILKKYTKLNQYIKPEDMSFREEQYPALNQVSDIVLNFYAI